MHSHETFIHGVINCIRSLSALLTRSIETISNIQQRGAGLRFQGIHDIHVVVGVKQKNSLFCLFNAFQCCFFCHNTGLFKHRFSRQRMRQRVIDNSNICQTRSTARQFLSMKILKINLIFQYIGDNIASLKLCLSAFLLSPICPAHSRVNFFLLSLDSIYSNDIAKYVAVHCTYDA